MQPQKGSPKQPDLSDKYVTMHHFFQSHTYMLIYFRSNTPGVDSYQENVTEAQVYKLEKKILEGAQG